MTRLDLMGTKRNRSRVLQARCNALAYQETRNSTQTTQNWKTMATKTWLRDSWRRWRKTSAELRTRKWRWTLKTKSSAPSSSQRKIETQPLHRRQKMLNQQRASMYRQWLMMLLKIALQSACNKWMSKQRQRSSRSRRKSPSSWPRLITRTARHRKRIFCKKT